MADTPTCSDSSIWDAWMSVYFFPALMIADRLNLFSYLARSPSTREEVRAHLGIEQRVSEALLGVLLATNPPFLTLRDGYLLLTDLSRNYLLRESPYYYGGVFQDAWVKHSTASLIWHKIKPEETPQEGLFASQQTLSQLWGSGTLTPQQAKDITQVMHSHSLPAALALSRYKYLFTGIERLLDVGGGSGCFSIALAEHIHTLHCIVMDLPAVCQVVHDYIACSQAAARVGTYSADMFAGSWPYGFDAIFFGDIFHDWSQDQCLDLAQRSYACLLPRGRIFLHEMLWNDTKDGPLISALYSLCMVRATDAGRQYSAQELREILHKAGFVDVSVLNLSGYHSLISARKEED